MSQTVQTTKDDLKALHDRIIKDGIGVFLPVMKELLAAVKAHLEATDDDK